MCQLNRQWINFDLYIYKYIICKIFSFLWIQKTPIFCSLNLNPLYSICFSISLKVFKICKSWFSYTSLTFINDLADLHKKFKFVAILCTFKHMTSLTCSSKQLNLFQNYQLMRKYDSFICKSWGIHKTAILHSRKSKLLEFVWKPKTYGVHHSSLQTSNMILWISLVKASIVYSVTRLQQL